MLAAQLSLRSLAESRSKRVPSHGQCQGSPANGHSIMGEQQVRERLAAGRPERNDGQLDKRARVARAA